MEYQALSAGADSDLGSAEPVTSRLRHRRHLAPYFLGAAAIVAFLLIFTADHRDDTRTLVPALECGNSPSEALSRGCSFDVMSFAWLPAPCFDKELMQDFLSLRNWVWYRDESGNEPAADPMAVASGQYDQLFVTQEYHMYHCTYMWRKMHRAVQRALPLDGYIGSMGHTEHCENMLVHQAPLNSTNTVIMSKYVNCPAEKATITEGEGWYRVVGGSRVYGFGHHAHSI